MRFRLLPVIRWCPFGLMADVSKRGVWELGRRMLNTDRSTEADERHRQHRPPRSGHGIDRHL